MTRSNTSRNRRRGSFKNPIQFMRGLILETLGVAVLIFLYFTMQATTAGGQSANTGVIEPVQVPGRLDLTTSVESDSIWLDLQQHLPQQQNLEDLPVWSSLSHNR